MRIHRLDIRGRDRDRRTPLTLRAAAPALLLLALLVGCGPSQELLDARADLRDAADRIETLRQENVELQNQIFDLQQLVQRLRGLEDKRMEYLFLTERISLGRFTGGVDTDDTPGDDVIRALLQPIDQHGSPLKAAGEITVEVYDLDREPPDHRICRRTIPPAEASTYWSGGFLTSHYAIDCPLPPDQRNPQLTVRAVFVEYLTGNRFTDQRTVDITLTPTPLPATQPAAD